MYIVSNDKDFQQLLEDDKIFLLKPVFNSKEKRWSTMTAEDFRESNHGLDPCKYPDIQALTGDAVDNVPGVKGIGQRIAPFLLSKSANKDLESLLADVDVLDDKYKRELKPKAEILPQMRTVLTIRRDINLGMALWLALRYRRKINIKEVDRIFGRLGGDSSSVREQLSSIGFKEATYQKVKMKY
mmetsp:Transcript_7371/g.32799  ORF Transcript_7371/g.32799 Transcript_7371/m.32799 type:complete len:185 (+) Transcript_7371:1413-1967(+)